MKITCLDPVEEPKVCLRRRHYQLIMAPFCDEPGFSIRFLLKVPSSSLEMTLKMKPIYHVKHRLAVSNPEVTTHQEGIIPRTAGSAPSPGSRSEKLVRQLNSNNDPPLHTPRKECDEGFVQEESRSSC
ncbi:uncharacterized protein RBU33_018908 isoform 1-T1 [Hipposideros larvatus]